MFTCCTNDFVYFTNPIKHVFEFFFNKHDDDYWFVS